MRTPWTFVRDASGRAKAARWLVVVALLLFWTARRSPGAPPDPSRFAGEIAAFAKADALNPPPDHPTVFAGSSTFRKWANLTDEFKDFSAINRAFGGSELTDVLFYLDQTVIRYKPAAVVIYCGTNDLAHGATAGEVVDRAVAVFEKIHSALPQTRIFYVSNIPAPVRSQFSGVFDKTNDRIQAYITDHPFVHYINARFIWSDADGKPNESLFLGDRLHPNAQGYRLLAPVIRAALASPATKPAE